MCAEKLKDSISEWHCGAQDLIKLRWDILSDLITDHFSLAADPPLWLKPKHVGRNPASTGSLSLIMWYKIKQALIQWVYFCCAEGWLCAQVKLLMPDRSVCAGSEVSSYCMEILTHNNSTKSIRCNKQSANVRLPLSTHSLISVQNVDPSSDKTDKPNESPSCFGLEEKPQVQYSRGGISLLSNSPMAVSSKCLPHRGKNIQSG